MLLMLMLTLLMLTLLSFADTFSSPADALASSDPPKTGIVIMLVQAPLSERNSNLVLVLLAWRIKSSLPFYLHRRLSMIILKLYR